MKQFFEFDRRKKENLVDQVVEQVITYINDYKLIHGMPLPDLTIAKKELNITNGEIKKILKILLDKGFISFNEIENQYLIRNPGYRYDFLVNVAPAYREIVNSGKKPAVFTLEKKEKVVDEALMNQFQGLTLGEKVLHYKRYMTADGVPMFYIEICFALDRLPLAGQIFEDHQPHLEILMQKYPQQYKFHIREVKVVHLPQNIKAIFKDTDPNSICTLGIYRFYNAKGEVVETGFAYMTDLTEFTTTTNDLTEILL